jgi:hypothetical protein
MSSRGALAWRSASAAASSSMTDVGGKLVATVQDADGNVVGLLQAS